MRRHQATKGSSFTRENVLHFLIWIPVTQSWVTERLYSNHFGDLKLIVGSGWFGRREWILLCTRLFITLHEMLRELVLGVSSQLTPLSILPLPLKKGLKTENSDFLVFRIITFTGRPKWLIPVVLHHDKIGVTQTKVGVELLYIWIFNRRLIQVSWCTTVFTDGWINVLRGFPEIFLQKIKYS